MVYRVIQSPSCALARSGERRPIASESGGRLLGAGGLGLDREPTERPLQPGGGDPRLALNQLQEVEQMGLDVVQPGFSLGVLLNLEKRLLNARDPLLQHVGEWGMHGNHSLLAEIPRL